MNPIALAVPSLPHATPLELIEVASAAGFDALGLRLARSRWGQQAFHTVVGNAPLIAEIKRRIVGTGLVILDLCSFYLTPDFDYDAFHSAMEVGAELGAKNAVVLGFDPDHRRACDTFARICEVAAPFGVTLAVEFAPVDQCWPSTLQQALQFLGEADHPNGALMLDPAHLLRSGGAIADVRAVQPGYLRFSQICDVEIVGDEFLPTIGRWVPKIRRRLLGEGVLPLSDFIDTLPQGLPLSVECLPQPSGMSNTEWAGALYASARHVLGSYHDSRRSSPPFTTIPNED